MEEMPAVREKEVAVGTDGGVGGEGAAERGEKAVARQRQARRRAPAGHRTCYAKHFPYARGGNNCGVL